MVIGTDVVTRKRGITVKNKNQSRNKGGGGEGKLRAAAGKLHVVEIIFWAEEVKDR